MSVDTRVLPSQMLTGSTLAATFGRGRYRGRAELTRDRLSFFTHKGERVFDSAISDVTEVTVSKLGVLSITAGSKIRICIDDQALGDTTVGQALSTMSGIQGIRDFAAELEERRKGTLA